MERCRAAGRSLLQASVSWLVVVVLSLSNLGSLSCLSDAVQFFHRIMRRELTIRCHLRAAGARGSHWLRAAPRMA